MTASVLLRELSDRGVQLSVAGDKLRFYPKSRVGPDLLDQMLAHKSALMELLQAVATVAADLEWHDTTTVSPPPKFTNDDWWSMLDDTQRAELLAPPNRPPKCFFCGGTYWHGMMCQELHDSWAIKIPFGKYRGMKIAEVPIDYLRWLQTKSSNLDSDIRDEIERALGRQL